jgi:hypothetical protein
MSSSSGGDHLDLTPATSSKMRRIHHSKGDGNEAGRSPSRSRRPWRTFVRALGSVSGGLVGTDRVDNLLAKMLGDVRRAQGPGTGFRGRARPLRPHRPSSCTHRTPWRRLQRGPFSISASAADIGRCGLVEYGERSLGGHRGRDVFHGTILACSASPATHQNVTFLHPGAPGCLRPSVALSKPIEFRVS